MMDAADPTLRMMFSNPNPLVMMGLFVGLALIPFVLLSVTSFVKLSVVFGIVKNAIGAQQLPSSAVVALLSLVLSAHIMSPVAFEMIEGIAADTEKSTSSRDVAGVHVLGNIRLSELGEFSEQLSAPLMDFLRQHSKARERLFFVETSNREKRSVNSGEQAPTIEVACVSQGEGEPCKLEGEGFLTLVPAFVLSELAEAFAIGFVIFLPFLIIDLVVANILVGLGMMIVSPVSIALPFKIILFVLCDGWFLLCRGLVLGYV